MSWCTSGPGPVPRLRHVRTLPPRILRGKCDILLAFSSTSRHSPKATRTQFPDNTRSNQPGHSNYSTQLDLNGILNRLKERAGSLSSATTLGLAEVGGRLTGYEHIEGLKHKVVETEAAIAAKRRASRDAKAAYEGAVARRSKSQREVNDFLLRKSDWTEADVNRFPAVLRADHLLEQAEAEAKTQVALTEAEVDAGFNELMRTILNRYHEEQVWSDKIRSASTYGSLVALGVNIAVFFLAIVVVEPWKRRRLAQTFEKRIEELSLENRDLLGRGMNNLEEYFGKQEQVLMRLSGSSLGGTHLDRHGTVMDSEGLVNPTAAIERTAKTARDRELWMAGAVGAVGGGVVTLLLGYFR